MSVRYANMTAWELRKMDWLKVEALTSTGNYIKWEISVVIQEVYILHNNYRANWQCPSNMKWYSHWWLIVSSGQGENDTMNYIERFESIDEPTWFTEWEEVYVSDYSEEDALWEEIKRIYLYTLPKWKVEKYICVNEDYLFKYNSWEDYETCLWKFIVKIPPKEEKIEEESVEMTMEEINKALGKKVKIVE